MAAASESEPSLAMGLQGLGFPTSTIGAEARGGIFVLTDNGGYDIEPEGILTHNERVFLLEHREEARRQ